MSTQDNARGEPVLLTQCADIGDGRRVCITVTLKEIAYCAGCPDCPADQREHNPACAWASTQRNTIVLNPPTMSQGECNPANQQPKTNAQAQSEACPPAQQQKPECCSPPAAQQQQQACPPPAQQKPECPPPAQQKPECPPPAQQKPECPPPAQQKPACPPPPAEKQCKPEPKECDEKPKKEDPCAKK